MAVAYSPITTKARETEQMNYQSQNFAPCRDSLFTLLSGRYCIFPHYIGVEPLTAYRHLMSKLGTRLLAYPLLYDWLIGRVEHQKTLLQVLQATLHSLLAENVQIKQQIKAIADLSLDPCPRDALLLTQLEIYCCEPMGEQPRLLFLLRDFLTKEPIITPLQADLREIIVRSVGSRDGLGRDYPN